MTTGEKQRVVVDVRGDLDASTVRRFDRLLADLCSKQPEAIIIDLSQSGYIDSCGFRALVSGRARMGSSERFVLRGVPPATRHLLEISGLVEEFVYEP